ncbi:MAG: putative xylanase/chitin deacetylase, partial [Microbacterium sp.]|nr:putative xylanase/chitin deacetylase [Microbacterium sp.]
MTTTRAQHRRRTTRRTRLRRTLAATTAIVLIAGGVTAFALTRGASTPTADGTTAPSVEDTPTPTPTPKTASEQLLATTTDPKACAVSFAGDGIALAPQLQTQDTLYAALPLPQADGRVFAGWYETAADAAAMTLPARVNGSDVVTCTAQEKTLHAGWTTPEANAAEDASIPI